MMILDMCNCDEFFELLPVGIFLIDKDLQIKGYNTKAIDLLGIEETDILIDNKSQLSYSTFMSLVSKIFSSKISSTHQVIELNNKFLSFTTQIIIRNDNQYLIIIIEDSTNINSLENIRRDYIGSILHSIRTPLATLTNSLNILSTTASDLLTGDNAEALAMSISEIARLNELIDNLKELFYIESGLAKNQIKLEPVQFKVIIDNVFKLLFQNDDISVENMTRFIINGDLDITLNIDNKKMSQSLYNIVKNALTYSSIDSQIHITINNEDSFVSIEVKNKGIGISEELMPLIFTKFFRIDNDINRKVYGHGLGLFFVKSWIELMNGTIMCESNQSGETIFTITLVNNVKQE